MNIVRHNRNILYWMRKPWLKFPFIMIGFILVFFVTMTIAYSLPNERIEINTQSSLESIEYVENYPNVFYSERSASLDLFTDRVMLNMNFVQNQDNYNVVQQAMDNNAYSRYWHGYQIFLRPLLEIFTYSQIKYLLMFVVFILFALCIILLKEKLNVGIALLFVAVTIAGYIILAPMCLQYSSVFIIMMSAIIAICKLYKSGEKAILKWAYTFLIIGMVTNFLDLLTFPMITLGMPLIVLFLLNLKYDSNYLLKRNIIALFVNSCTWFIGYAFTWIAKWILASIILHRNVIQESILQIFFRTRGDEQYPVDRSIMFHDNFNNYFGALENKFWIILAIILIAFLILYIFFKKPVKTLTATIPFLVVMVYPVIWMLVLSNHSQIHAFFVYRILMILPFAFFSAVIYLIDWMKLKEKINKRKVTKMK